MLCCWSFGWCSPMGVVSTVSFIWPWVVLVRIRVTPFTLTLHCQLCFFPQLPLRWRPCWPDLLRCYKASSKVSVLRKKIICTLCIHMHPILPQWDNAIENLSFAVPLLTWHQNVFWVTILQQHRGCRLIQWEPKTLEWICRPPLHHFTLLLKSVSGKWISMCQRVHLPLLFPVMMMSSECEELPSTTTPPLQSLSPSLRFRPGVSQRTPRKLNQLRGKAQMWGRNLILHFLLFFFWPFRRKNAEQF